MKELRILIILMFALYGAMPVSANAAPNSAPTPVVNIKPSDVIKNFYAQLLAVMKAGDTLGYAGRFKKLDPAIQAAYNMPLMTRLATGPGWAEATPEEQQQLISAFSDFSVANYASQFKTYKGEDFQVVDEKPFGSDGVMVDTILTPSNHPPVPINYLMKRDDNGAYRIVDVFLDGAISELATRRAEFGAIVRRDGVAALVNSLSAKSKEMGPT